MVQYATQKNSAGGKAHSMKPTRGGGGRILGGENDGRTSTRLDECNGGRLTDRGGAGRFKLGELVGSVPKRSVCNFHETGGRRPEGRGRFPVGAVSNFRGGGDFPGAGRQLSEGQFSWGRWDSSRGDGAGGQLPGGGRWASPREGRGGGGVPRLVQAAHDEGVEAGDLGVPVQRRDVLLHRPAVVLGDTAAKGSQVTARVGEKQWENF